MENISDPRYVNILKKVNKFEFQQKYKIIIKNITNEEEKKSDSIEQLPPIKTKLVKKGDNGHIK